jgi:hypothetical protein
VDRLSRHAGRPSLGLGERAIEAIENALEAFEGIVSELLATVPDALSG